MRDIGEAGFRGFEEAREPLAGEGVFEERARTWLSIFEVAGTALGVEEGVKDFGGTGSGSEVASGGVTVGEEGGVLATTVERFVPLVFF